MAGKALKRHPQRGLTDEWPELFGFFTAGARAPPGSNNHSRNDISHSNTPANWPRFSAERRQLHPLHFCTAALARRQKLAKLCAIVDVA
jgi:hypothetical protein